MKFHSLLSLSLVASMILPISSCVSTETLEPQNKSGESKEIILNLGAPESALTRATDGYKLRYTAKIFRGGSSQAWGEALQRKEIIDGENALNQIVFKVEPGYDYAIMAFADYIPENTQQDASGHYTDYFYNSTRYQKRWVMRVTPGSDAESVSADFFNNDKYDAFFNIETLHKDEYEVTVNMTLNRIVAQVIFQENSENTGQASVIVNKLGYRKNFDADTNNSFLETLTTGGLNLKENASITSDNKNLFYFYTLTDTNDAKKYVSASFTSASDGKLPVDINVTDIPVAANYRTIVKGSYVPSQAMDEEPKDEDGPKIGDIILNMTANYQWEQQPIEK